MKVPLGESLGEFSSPTYLFVYTTVSPSLQLVHLSLPDLRICLVACFFCLCGACVRAHMSHRTCVCVFVDARVTNSARLHGVI